MRDSDGLQAYDFEQLTVAGTSVGLTPAKYIVTPPCQKVEMFLTGAPIRFRKDGTAPTASVGEILNPYDRLALANMTEVANIRFIRTGATSGTLNAHYRR